MTAEHTYTKFEGSGFIFSARKMFASDFSINFSSVHGNFHKGIVTAVMVLKWYTQFLNASLCRIFWVRLLFPIQDMVFLSDCDAEQKRRRVN